VFANEYQNSDLFYGLRGGGGGTFGIVVSVTVRAYSDYPVVFTQTNYTLAAPNTLFWKGIEAFHNYLVPLNDNGGSGYYYITPVSPISETQAVSTFVSYMWFVNQTDPSVPESLFPPLLSDLQNATKVAPFHQVIPFPSMSSMYGALFIENDTTGQIGLEGSRLISRSFFQSPGASAKISTAISRLKVGPSDYIEGNIVGGGQVIKNEGMRSGLNPAWRETLVHLLFTRQWTATTTFAQQAVIKANITSDEVPLLKSLEPGRMGAYMNEADADEANFQESFWGANYATLYEIKKKRDPTDLFIVRKGVGSENWNDSGLCRLK
jgi:hypothetical protein